MKTNKKYVIMMLLLTFIIVSIILYFMLNKERELVCVNKENDNKITYKVVFKKNIKNLNIKYDLNYKTLDELVDNYDNVIRFLRLVSCKEGVNIGLRHISLSTCGVVDKIYKLSKEKLPITLSISLHAPNDNIRSITMPINKKWGVDDLIIACKDYIKETNRRISFEYAMIKGLNDTDECAEELGEKLSGILCHVNLILINEVNGTKYKKSGKERVEKFISILSKKGLNVTVRRKLGYDIDASCGQLKRNYLKGEGNTYENI